MKTDLSFTLRICVMLILMAQYGSTMAQQAKLPAYRTAYEKSLLGLQSKETNRYGKSGWNLPAGIRYPGEFEPSQAVVISWADGYTFDGLPTGNVDTTDDWGRISAQLCDFIQPECPVWIRVNKGTDTTRILAYMQNRGKPLYSYRFFISQGDGWWIRDFGPNGIYYGQNDSVAFVDLKYYPGRELDNKFPVFLSKQLGYPNFESELNSEGGNLMTDGFGRLFYSTVVTDVNTSGTVHNPAWTAEQTTDTMRVLFNASNIHELRTLECDGGTGHIDLYLKLMDEQTLFVAEYPKEMKSQDKQIIEDNYQYLTTLKTAYNRPFRIFRVPLPTGDNGKYNDTTCTQINNDARSFVNGLTVNKTFIYPGYADGTNGNRAQTDSVTNLFKYLLPGYNIYPVDARSMSMYGGELHCITMQIPDENPVLFWHPSIDGLQPLKQSFSILAKISSAKGIQQAECKWRKRGAVSWNTVLLTDSSGYFTGTITDPSITESDKIEYYLSATAGSKTAVKPITAPKGFYTIYFRTGVGMDENRIAEKPYLFGAYPNPANNQITLPFYAMHDGDEAKLEIRDIHGKILSDISVKARYGLNNTGVDISGFENGIYFYSCTIGGTYIATRKFLIVR